MVDRLEFDPEKVRLAEEQHRRMAAWIDEFGEPDHEFLRTFEQRCGPISRPVKLALDRFYYDEFQPACKALAERHRYNERALYAFRTDMQHTDEDGARAISYVANGAPGPGASLTSTGQSGPGLLAGGPAGPMPVDGPEGTSSTDAESGRA